MIPFIFTAQVTKQVISSQPHGGLESLSLSRPKLTGILTQISLTIIFKNQWLTKCGLGQAAPHGNLLNVGVGVEASMLFKPCGCQATVLRSDRWRAHQCYSNIQRQYGQSFLNEPWQAWAPWLLCSILTAEKTGHVGWVHGLKYLWKQPST